jgi:membrane protein DedA with SNARE-associated domain
MNSWLPDVPGFIETRRYFAVWLLMWVETFFPIFPSEMVMPLGALVASQGKMTLWGVIFAGTAGAMTGACVWYFAARWLGYERFSALVTRYGRITTVSPHEVAKLQGWFDRYGALTVFAGRLIPGVRSAVSIPAGLTQMPFVPFFLYSVAGAGLWSSAMAIAGWLLRNQYERIHEYIGPAVKLIIVAALCLWIVRMIRFKRV